MRKFLGMAVAVMIAGQAMATVYNDATGDLHDGSGSGADFSVFPHLDIASVEITNDASVINFAVTLVGDIQATDWGKYLVHIDSVPGGETFGNGWNRPINMPSGADYWLGSWVDSGGGMENHRWDGSVWVRDNATWDAPTAGAVSLGISQFTATMTVDIAALGLAIGDSFVFDVYSSGGGTPDGAIDALSQATPSALDWGDSYDTSSTLTYTLVPEPTTAALIAVGALALIRRR